MGQINRDLILTCAKCGSHFYFTTGEQQFYKSHGLNIPKYCKQCRANKHESYVSTSSPRACSTCYFSCMKENTYALEEQPFCTYFNERIINDAPCKYWQKG